VQISYPKQDAVHTAHVEDLNLLPSQFELPDDFLPSLNPERSIIVYPSANLQDVTPLSMQRSRRPGRWIHHHT
ncbi:hypothetical protein HAX54_016621, partial [Datura stramonium]|nr:hypothetical protein [Datura stramonium]